MTLSRINQSDAEPAFSEDDVEIVNCEIDDPTIEVGTEVFFSADVRNDNDVDADVTLEFSVGSDVDTESLRVGAGQTRTFNQGVTTTQAGSFDAEAVISSAFEVIGF